MVVEIITMTIQTNLLLQMVIQILVVEAVAAPTTPPELQVVMVDLVL